MLVTEGVRDALRSRARMTAAVRRLLEARGFLEVPAPWRAGARAGTALSSFMRTLRPSARPDPRAPAATQARKHSVCAARACMLSRTLGKPC